MIGLDRNNWLVYEGVSNYGHGVWPTPVVTRATLIERSDDWGSLPSASLIDDAKLVFREDSFDLITRMRRGRLYEWQAGQSQPCDWYVNQHPAVFNDVGPADHQGRLRKSLLSYSDVRGLGAKISSSNTEIVIALGSRESLTLWTVVAVETVASGQEMLTLRARANLGVLPEIDYTRVPTGAVDAVTGALSKLRTSAYREQASSVVEQCRPTAQIILSHWFDAVAGVNVKGDDLGDVIKKIENHEAGKVRQILLNTGRTLNLFHSRNKPNVREKLGELARGIKESDAAFALQAVALLLHEVGWTKA